MNIIKKHTFVHYGLVLMIVAALCGLAIGATNAITAPIIEERLTAERLEAYKLVMSGIADDDVLLDDEAFQVIVAYDENANTIGYVYTVTETNQHGDFIVIVGVDTIGEVIGATFLKYEQTPTYKPITEANLDLFIGLNILSQVPNSSDINAGATNSYNSLESVFNKIKNFQQTEVMSVNTRGIYDE